MSSNIYNGKDLHADIMFKRSGIDFTDAKAIAEAPQIFRIGNNDGAAIELAGWEAILLPIAILQAALHDETFRAGIAKPSPEQLDQLRDILEKLGPLIPLECNER